MIQSAGTPVRFYSIFWCCCPDSTCPEQDQGQDALTLSVFVIAVYMVLDSDLLLISLSFRHARSIQFPADAVEYSSTYINFDVSQRDQNDHPVFPDPRSPTCACATVHRRSRQCLSAVGPCRFWQLMVPFGTTIVVCWSSPRWDLSSITNDAD